MNDVQQLQRKYPVWRAADIEEIAHLRTELLVWKEPILDLDLHEYSQHFVLCGGGQFYGCSSMGLQQPPCGPDTETAATRFWAVAIVPEKRGRGYWSQLHAQRVKMAMAMGTPVLWANVRSDAWDIYAAHDFSFIGEEKLDPNIAGEVVVRPMMAKLFKEAEMPTESLTIIDPDKARAMKRRQVNNVRNVLNPLLPDLTAMVSVDDPNPDA